MRFKLGSIALCVAGLIASTGAQAACHPNIVADAPDARYTVNGETVADTYTGLMWKRCVEGLSGATCSIGTAANYSWQRALQQAATANAQVSAGFSDWRLPNRNELDSLVERKCSNRAINETVFPGTPAPSSWTSSTNHRVINGTQAWTVEFNVGQIIPLLKSELRPIRLVRSGS